MREHATEAPRYHLVALWEASDRRGRNLVWANLHEDGGTIWERIGPFRTLEEVVRKLRSLGELRLDPE